MPAPKPRQDDQDGDRYSWPRSSCKAKDEAGRRRANQARGARELKGWCREALRVRLVPTPDCCRELLHLGDADDGAVRHGRWPAAALACAPLGAVAILRERRCGGTECVRQWPWPPTADAGTQCDAEEFADHMFGTRPIKRREFLDRLRRGVSTCTGWRHTSAGWERAEGPISYSVAVHFSLFDDADTLAEKASRLPGAQLDELADRFLGSQIAGVGIKRERRTRLRLVADRHVAEASRIAQRSPHFRRCLLMSSRRLLLGCARKGSPPLHGRGLLRLAYEQEETWARLASTALDFACRLIRAGALPQALAAEMLSVMLRPCPPGLVPGLSSVLGQAPGAARCWAACPPGEAGAPHALPRSTSLRMPAPALPRAWSAPAEFSAARRSVATSLPHAPQARVALQAAVVITFEVAPGDEVDQPEQPPSQEDRLEQLEEEEEGEGEPRRASEATAGPLPLAPVGLAALGLAALSPSPDSTSNDVPVILYASRFLG